MIESFEDLSEWSLSESADNFIAICDGIADRNLSLAIIAGKISYGIYSSSPNKINFIIDDFFFLKLR